MSYSDPSSIWRAATLDSDLAFNGTYPRGVYVGGAGAVSVIDATGTTVVFSAAVAGTVLPIRPVQITTSGTTATNLRLLY